MNPPLLFMILPPSPSRRENMLPWLIGVQKASRPLWITFSLPRTLQRPRNRCSNYPDGKRFWMVEGAKRCRRLLVSIARPKLHPDLKVVAFDAPYTGTAPGARDEALGHALLSLRPAKPNGLVLILTGNLHAMQASKRYDLAATYSSSQRNPESGSDRQGRRIMVGRRNGRLRSVEGRSWGQGRKKALRDIS